MLVLAVCFGQAHAASASSTAAAATTDKWHGTAGAGAMVFPKYVGGRGSQTWPIPLLSLDYDETFYVEIERVGVYVLASDDKKIGLGFAVEPRFGYSAKDGGKLSGMATRRDSIEGGPTFDWDFDFVAVSLAAFGDLNRSSHGYSQRATVYSPLIKNAKWDVGALLAVDHMNARLANYYFGVPLNEANAMRPAYSPGAGNNTTLGLSGTYNLDKRNALMFGASSARLARSAASSPIAETNRATTFYFGYGWRL